jgi:hypothetical protein
VGYILLFLVRLAIGQRRRLLPLAMEREGTAMNVTIEFLFVAAGLFA